MAAKIETVEELETKLQEDLAWRKKEMLSIKMMADKGDANESILLRSGITCFVHILKDLLNLLLTVT